MYALRAALFRSGMAWTPSRAETDLRNHPVRTSDSMCAKLQLSQRYRGWDWGWGWSAVEGPHSECAYKTV